MEIRVKLDLGLLRPDRKMRLFVKYLLSTYEAYIAKNLLK